MATGVKLDEALSPWVAQPLTARGYDVRTVRDQAWAGLKDEQLWPLVQNERVFFTLDKGHAPPEPARPRAGDRLHREDLPSDKRSSDWCRPG